MIYIKYYASCTIKGKVLLSSVPLQQGWAACSSYFPKVIVKLFEALDKKKNIKVGFYTDNNFISLDFSKYLICLPLLNHNIFCNHTCPMIFLLSSG